MTVRPILNSILIFNKNLHIYLVNLLVNSPSVLLVGPTVLLVGPSVLLVGPSVLLVGPSVLLVGPSVLLVGPNNLESVNPAFHTHVLFDQDSFNIFANCSIVFFISQSMPHFHDLSLTSAFMHL